MRPMLFPARAGEGLQVLRYQKEQKYDAHWVRRLSAPKACNAGCARLPTSPPASAVAAVPN